MPGTSVGVLRSATSSTPSWPEQTVRMSESVATEGHPSCLSPKRTLRQPSQPACGWRRKRCVGFDEHGGSKDHISQGHTSVPYLDPLWIDNGFQVRLDVIVTQLAVRSQPKRVDLSLVAEKRRERHAARNLDDANVAKLGDLLRAADNVKPHTRTVTSRTSSQRRRCNQVALHFLDPRSTLDPAEQSVDLRRVEHTCSSSARLCVSNEKTCTGLTPVGRFSHTIGALPRTIQYDKTHESSRWCCARGLCRISSPPQHLARVRQRAGEASIRQGHDGRGCS